MSRQKLIQSFGVTTWLMQAQAEGLSHEQILCEIDKKQLFGQIILMK